MESIPCNTTSTMYQQLQSTGSSTVWTDVFIKNSVQQYTDQNKQIDTSTWYWIYSVVIKVSSARSSFGQVFKFS